MAAVAALAMSACDGSSTPEAAGSPSARPPSTATAKATSPTPEERAKPPPPPDRPPPTSGKGSPTCLNGWGTPPKGSKLWNRPLKIVRESAGVPGPLVVTDMRYFTGPESPPTDKGYLLTIQRWYLRLWARRDPAFQGRFLVESRRFGSGLSAVAPYDSKGFESPDWRGFQYDSAHPEPETYPGLPGAWSGIPYDFVRGGEGLTFPGLPKEVTGCLDGT